MNLNSPVIVCLTHLPPFLCKELEFYQNKLNESQHLENKIKMFVDKDVWFWENDGENHLESLACPIVIDADTLRKLIKNGG